MKADSYFYTHAVTKSATAELPGKEPFQGGFVYINSYFLKKRCFEI
jgi:hypothetical protein